MDSFLSLFDPSEGGAGAARARGNKQWSKPDQDTAKKKPDAPKGRRRGRKSVGKSETLPEESSFLCEPHLSTELLVKDGSYIESFIEVNKPEEDPTADADRKPKRRNSARKCRRKKNKVSPAKDSAPAAAWAAEPDTTAWNNRSSKPKVCDENIGKNVNDLKNDHYKNAKRKNSSDALGALEERAVYNVIEKLEKVGLKDDAYLAGDFNTEDLENDFFYSSDDEEESFDDTASEPSDSGEEACGSLPPEPRFGNVEYKLQLVSPCERRFQHLVTQLKWRLRSGGGGAVYVVGVRDCGALRGLRARALRGSLRTLRRMALALHAELTHVTARRVAHRRAVAEVYIRKLADTQQSVELRVAVMGANEAGKSTLIGVLTQGELDNGRGSARLNMFRHVHEVKSGRTSSLSHEILGFDAQGNVVNYGCSELMTAERIGERSAKLVSFLDLAGHSKYQRTTLHGLTGYSPHYAMLVISATAGVTRITEEHLGLLVALDLPFFAVLTKCELAPPAVQPLVARLEAILASAGKKPVLITEEGAARGCVAPPRLILDAIADPDADKWCPLERVPVFPVSCVRGAGLAALHAYLLALQPPAALPAQTSPEDETCEFQIDEIFNVGDSGGPVVGGLLCRGRLRERDDVIIGPLESGEFARISVRSIYRNRVPHGSVRAGQSASLGLGPAPAALRPGMVLLAAPDGYQPGARERPTLGGCHPGRCKRKDEVAELIQSRQQTRENAKNRKNVRRKNKNLLQHLAKVEHSLVKVDNIEDSNIYKSDSDGGKLKVEVGLDPADVGLGPADVGLGPVDVGLGPVDVGLDPVDVGKECSCNDEVLLEDPNDPRGCIYFQATVQVLRHATTIYPGFQCTVHVGNVTQTAIIEGILSHKNELRALEAASVLFRFTRYPEYLVRGRQMLFTAGLGTRAIGRITQIFPYVP